MINFTDYKHILFEKSNTFRLDENFDPHVTVSMRIMPVQKNGVYVTNFFEYSENSDTHEETYINSTDISNSILRDFVNLVLNVEKTYKDINDYIETNQISNDRLLTNVVISNSTNYFNNDQSSSSQSAVIFSPFSIYENPVDNYNVFQILNGISQAWNTNLSDDDYKKIKAIEAYNSNFIKWYSMFNSADISSSSSEIDLTTINTQLTNIANNLKTTVHNDESGEDIEVSVTDIIKDKEDTVNVLNQIEEVQRIPKQDLYPFQNDYE